MSYYNFYDEERFQDFHAKQFYVFMRSDTTSKAFDALKVFLKRALHVCENPKLLMDDFTSLCRYNHHTYEMMKKKNEEFFDDPSFLVHQLSSFFNFQAICKDENVFYDYGLCLLKLFDEFQEEYKNEIENKMLNFVLDDEFQVYLNKVYLEMTLFKNEPNKPKKERL